MLTQAISRTKPTAPNRTSTERRSAGSILASSRVRATAPHGFAPGAGNLSGCASLTWAPRTSTALLACSTLMSGLSRPTIW